MSLALAFPTLEADPIATGFAVAAVVACALVYVARAARGKRR
jgi:hypothetical protein